MDTKLLHIDLWKCGGSSYYVFIYWNGSQFVFEGKIKVGMDRHTYFPYTNCPKIEIGAKGGAVEFLTEYLTMYACPPTILSEFIYRVKEWDS